MKRAPSAEMLEIYEIFRDLTMRQLEGIAGIAEIREAPAGEDIFNERDPAEALFVVRNGMMEMRLDVSSGSTVAVSTVGAGKAFGWSAVLGRQAYSVTVRSLEPSSLIAVPAAPLRRMMLQDKDLAIALLTAVGRMTAARLEDARYQIVGIMDNRRRVARVAPRE